MRQGPWSARTCRRAGARRRWCALAALALVAGACGGDDGDAKEPATTAAPGVTTATTATSGGGASTTAAGGGDEGCTDARKGGELNFSAYLLTRSMDPTVSFGSASTGSIEMAAVYDTLMRWDDAKGTFEPRVAESLTPNADASVWTMKLRPGIKFGNGDPLTTADVKASIERHQDPANLSTQRLDASTIDTMVLKDDLTMEFHLKEPWGTFPFLLADNTGLIVNTKVLNAMGKDAFGMKPTGAGVGPYEVESFTPNEKLVLKAKDDYWGGPVCIQKITVTDIPLEQATFDALDLGEIDLLLTEDPRVLSQAKAKHFGTHVDLDHTGGFIMINSGLRGSTPDTRDVRLRKAVAAAIDAKALSQRIWGADGQPNTAIISDGSPLSPGVPGPKYDPVEAKRLVAEAKASGWDGTLSLVCSATNPDVPVAIEGYLEAVGIDVQSETLQTGALVQRVNIEGNYEITCSSMVTFDASPFVGMNRWFGPGNSFTGFSDPTFDSKLKVLKAAQTPAQIKAAVGDLQTTYNDTIPSVVYAAVPWAQAWSDKVHGLVFNLQGGVLFHDAWIEK